MGSVLGWNLAAIPTLLQGQRMGGGVSAVWFLQAWWASRVLKPRLLLPQPENGPRDRLLGVGR